MSLSLALLFAVLGSVIAAGGVTVAVFDRVPEALMSSVPVAVNVAVPPTSRFTVWLMFPEPLAAAQLEPPEATHVHVTPVRLAGKVSATVAPVAADGPALLTVIVYVTGEPAGVVVRPSVLVIERSAWMLTTMQPVPTTLWPSGLVRVTFLVPFELELMFSVTDVGLLNVTLLTITPGVTLAVRRLYPGPPVSGPGSKKPEPADEVPVMVTFCGDVVTWAGTAQLGVAGGGATSLIARTPYELVALVYSWNVHIVMSSLGSTPTCE